MQLQHSYPRRRTYLVSLILTTPSLSEQFTPVLKRLPSDYEQQAEHLGAFVGKREA
jgi:energy-converting hydrogenase Eha subunit A